MLDRRADAALFVAGRNHDGEQFERRYFRGVREHRSSIRTGPASRDSSRAWPAISSRMEARLLCGVHPKSWPNRGAVHHDPRNVEGPRLQVGRRRWRPNRSSHQAVSSRERHRVPNSAAARVRRVRRRDAGRRICAATSAARSRDGRRRGPASHVRRIRCSAAAGGAACAFTQIREDPLLGRAELSRAGQHAAAIDPHGKAERRAVLERHDLGGELGGAVQRDRRRDGKASVRPPRTDAGRQRRP